jgi:lipoprotein-anchoring transpeptidase ErfK/SrfK
MRGGASLRIGAFCIVAGFGASASAQQVEHRAYGMTAMGGIAAAPRRTEAPLWPSAQGATAAALPLASSWQQRATAQPVSLPPSRQASRQQRRIVPFAHAYPTGALVVVNRERALYHVLSDGRAMRYPVAIGSFTEEWIGFEVVSDKKANPTWYPVIEPGKEVREPVPGGDPTNPLGARALYLGRTLWRIHGTPAEDTIGHNVSNGCIRMLNEHVVELYEQIMLGTEVYVVDRLGDAAPGHRGRKVIE